MTRGEADNADLVKFLEWLKEEACKNRGNQVSRKENAFLSSTWLEQRSQDYSVTFLIVISFSDVRLDLVSQPAKCVFDLFNRLISDW